MVENLENLTKRQIVFLERLTETRERLNTSIEGLDPDVICGESVLGDWTIKDIIGHLVTWNQEFRANIAMILKGQHPGYDHIISERDNFLDWNQVGIERKRDWSLDRIMADLDGDYAEAEDLIKALSPDDYSKRGVTPWKDAALQKPEKLVKDDTDTVETLVTFHWRHMHMHIRDIEKWRAQRLNYGSA